MPAVRFSAKKKCPEWRCLMNALVALCAAVVGYLLGSLSFSRIISRLAAPQTDIAHTEVPDLPDNRWPIYAGDCHSIPWDGNHLLACPIELNLQRSCAALA
jgi:ketopantoate reductase